MAAIVVVVAAVEVVAVAVIPVVIVSVAIVAVAVIAVVVAQVAVAVTDTQPQHYTTRKRASAPNKSATYCMIPLDIPHAFQVTPTAHSAYGTPPSMPIASASSSQ